MSSQVLSQASKLRSPTSVAVSAVIDNDISKRNKNGDVSRLHVHSKPKQQHTHTKHPEMVVDKRVIDELLLVCGVIGSTQTDQVDMNRSGRNQPNADPSEVPMTTFVPVTDCLAWLQDLQRALRRDNDQFRPINLLLGQWRVVATKLLPLAMSCRYDRGLVLTVCKILVILTKPLSESAWRAGSYTIDTKSGKVDESVIQEQILLRDNAIAQADLLMEYKKTFVKHPSHHYAFQTVVKDINKGGTGLLSIFTSLLAEPLSKIGSSRTASDHLTIELVLHLIRNLLTISPISTFGSTEIAQNAGRLHRELIVLLEKEMVLEVLICVGQEVERRENEGYNLLLMEILSCLLRGQDPFDVAMSSIQSAPSCTYVISPSKSKITATTSATTRTKLSSNRTAVRTKAVSSQITGPNSLRAHLQAERSKLHLTASTRHSHFGGTLLLSHPDGKLNYVSANDYLTQNSKNVMATKGISDRTTFTPRYQPPRRKNKKVEVFIGSIKSAAIHARPGAASAAFSHETAGPIARRATLALNSFCEKFLRKCYGPVMKSWKNEFRRDSNRLEDGDRAMFFRIVWFFHQWWRVRRQDASLVEDGMDEINKEGSKETVEGVSPEKSIAHNLIFTMDVFMFNLVLNSTDEYHDHKKLAELAQTVALYSEMIHMLHAMYSSKDSTEQMMALGLMDRIFYSVEPLDRLPKLLSRWSPGMFPREYLCDLVECSHVTWKLLDANYRRCQEFRTKNGSEESNRTPKDAIERMNMTASEFDKDAYFLRKFVSNHIMFMYTQLLSLYAVNATPINRHILAYFLRLCKFSIKSNDDCSAAEFVLEEGAATDKKTSLTAISTQPSTLEPMLYNISLFSIWDTLLHDPSIRDKEDFSALLQFASSCMKRFSRAAEANPMLYVEALFRHPLPHRYCVFATNMYVNEELRMIVVRDRLLEEQRMLEEKEGWGKDAIKDNETGYNDEEELEVEFNDDNMDAVKISSSRLSAQHPKKHGAPLQMKDNEIEKSDDEMEFDGNADVDTDTWHHSKPPLSLALEDEDDAGIRVVASKKVQGKKRIRKSSGSVEESDEEEFSNATKVRKRVILEDDDEDGESLVDE